MTAGDNAAGSNDEVTLHGVTGIKVIKNQSINSRQKALHYDTIEINIVKEDAFGQKINFSMCLFGKEGVQL